MMFPQLLGFIPSIVGGVKDYTERKQKMRQLKTESELRIMEAKLNSDIRRAESADKADTELDKTSIENTGWMDEYLLILTTTPQLLLLLSPFVDIALNVYLGTNGGMPQESVTVSTGLLNTAVSSYFDALSKAPDWYWYMLGAVYIHALGMRRMVRLLIEKWAGKVPLLSRK